MESLVGTGFQLMEALLAFVVADADPRVVANIETFHDFRYETGVYVGEGEQAGTLVPMKKMLVRTYLP